MSRLHLYNHWLGKAIALCVVALPLRAATLPDVRDLDVKNWDCLHEEEGSAHDPADGARNKMKNRPWVAPSPVAPQWSVEQFVQKTKGYDTEIGATTRKKLTASQKKRLAEIEKQIVSVTGWVTLVYPGPKETTNCGSEEFHDWHVELLARPLDHVPHPGDPTSIICEIAPRTEKAIYQSGIRLQKIAAFLRQGEPPNIEDAPTGGVAHKVRITGYLMWDDQHNKADKDIGPTITTGGGHEYHHPWRQTAWEIHPILKIEDLGTKE